MLLATYALSTLSVEQKKQRGFIERLQHRLRHYGAFPGQADAQAVLADIDRLSRFAEARHQGKVEQWLMPAVRRASADAAPLLADLESLSRTGGLLLGELRSTWQRTVQRDAGHLHQLLRSVELYCQNLLHRLAKEEHELLPLAQRVLSSDGWFSIGAGFLRHDAGQAGKFAATATATATFKAAPARPHPARM